MRRRILSLAPLLAVLATLTGSAQALPQPLPERAAAPLTVSAPPQAAARESFFPSTLTPDPFVEVMIKQVVSSTVLQVERELAGELPVWVEDGWYTIATRHTHSGTPIWKATRYVGEHLAGLGLDVEYHAWADATNPNVIGEVRGSVDPDEVWIIGAHLDDVVGTPGADDNASGSAAVLVAADILTQYEWGCTLRFALWTGEEQGMLGSKAYAQRANQEGEGIAGVLNLDMIAYNSPGSPPGMDLYYDPLLPATHDLAQLFADVVEDYSLDLDPQVLAGGSGGSDHQSFWGFGYTAILAIEDMADFNPKYHRAGDTPANNDLTYFTEFVRASLGTFVHMTNCLLPNGTGAVEGQVTAESDGAPLKAATLSFDDMAGHHYSVSTDSDGYYTRTLPAGSYDLTVRRAGYIPRTVPGVVVQTDTVSELDLVLQELFRMHLPLLIRRG